MNKRIISIVLCLLMTMSLVPLISYAGTPVTPESVPDSSKGIKWKLEQIMKLYPDKSCFTNSGTVCSHSTNSSCSNCDVNSAISGKYANPGTTDANALEIISDAKYNHKFGSANTCVAFAHFVLYELYGSEGFTDQSGALTRTYDPVMGDVMCYYNSSGQFVHVGIFIQWINKSEGSFIIYDNNGYCGGYYPGNNNNSWKWNGTADNWQNGGKTNGDGNYVYGTAQVRLGGYNNTYSASSSRVRFYHSNYYDARNTQYKNLVCSHSHVDSLGVCTNCGEYIPSKDSAYVKSYKDFSKIKTAAMINADKVCAVPYKGYNEGRVKQQPAGTVLRLKGSFVNQKGNVWYQTEDGGWIFEDNLRDIKTEADVTISTPKVTVSYDTARVEANITKKAGMDAQYYGLIYKDYAKAKQPWIQYIEPDVAVSDKMTSYRLWLDFKNECKIDLIPGHGYACELFVVIDDVTYFSEMVSFTAGAPDEMVYSIDVSAIEALGSREVVDDTGAVVDSEIKTGSTGSSSGGGSQGGSQSGQVSGTCTFEAADSSYQAKYFVTETNACPVAKVVKTSGLSVTSCGVCVFDDYGNTYGSYEMPVTNVSASSTSFHIWFDLNSECGIYLQPGTHYSIQFFVTAGGYTYWSFGILIDTPGGQSQQPVVTPSAPIAIIFDYNDGVTSPETRYIRSDGSGFWGWFTDETGTEYYWTGLPAAYKEGFTFEGWYYGSTLIRECDPVTLSSGSTVKASFTGRSYPLFMWLCDGTVGQLQSTYSFGEPLGKLPVLERKGYEFTGWYTRENGGSKVDQNTVITTEGCELYAHWEKEKSSLPFTDVAESAWYYGEVRRAYEAGLINGTTPTTFAPNKNMTMAEAIKLAACVHQVNHGGKVTLTDSTDRAWYMNYYDYLKNNHLTSSSIDYTDFKKNVTRSEMATIFYYTIGGGELPYINNIPDNSIPDVKLTQGNIYRNADIYAMYKGGILAGSDDYGTFHPDNNIRRSEVAAILIRMIDKDARVAAPPRLGK